MARFDVYRLREGVGLVLDCQADLLAHLQTRFVVPLVPREEAPSPLIDGLNPSFIVDGQAYVLVTQFAGTMLRTELGSAVASLMDQDYEIGRAIDLLLSGV